MIINCIHNNKKISFIDEKKDTRENIFSVLVGINGVGKSRLLSSISINASDIKNLNASLKTEGLSDLSKNLKAKYSKKFNRVIACSISPFDKFPIAEINSSNETAYKYLGIRNIKGQNIGFLHMSRILGELIDKIIKNNLKPKIIGSILKYLGYEETIKFKFSSSTDLFYTKSKLQYKSDFEDIIKLNPEFKLLLHPFEFHDSIKERIKSFEELQTIARKKLYDKEIKITKNQKDDLSLFSYFVSGLQDVLRLGFDRVDDFFNFHDLITKLPAIEIEIKNGAYSTNIKNEILEDIIKNRFLLFIKNKTINVKSILVSKDSHKKKINLASASSGEQSVLLSLFGIATYIENNTLILIDEPEICLHPSWQEKYISLLTDCFSEKSECHFVIATHSPQIISNLQENNCYIIDLTKNETYSSKDYIKKSADYQLLNIFHTPGYRNQFLIKEISIALSIFSSKIHIETNEINKFEDLVEYRKLLKSDDPTVDLLDILEKSIKIYKNKND